MEKYNLTILNKLIGAEFSGKEFNEFYNYSFIKLTNRKCIHNGYKFVEGLNIDTNETKGIYFTTIDNAGKWLFYNDNIMYYIWDIEIPNNAVVNVDKNGYKTDKIILKRKKVIWYNENIYVTLLKQNGLALQIIPKWCINKKIYEICVKQNGLALQYIPYRHRTKELCVFALENNYISLRYVPDEHMEEEPFRMMIKKILNDNPLMIKYAKHLKYI